MGSFLPSVVTEMFPSENFSTKELTPKMVCSIAVAGSAFPSVFVAKSPCGDWEGDGIAGRAGTALAAGAVVVATGAAVSATAANEGELLSSAESDKRSANTSKVNNLKPLWASRSDSESAGEKKLKCDRDSYLSRGCGYRSEPCNSNSSSNGTRNSNRNGNSNSNDNK